MMTKNKIKLMQNQLTITQRWGWKGRGERTVLRKGDYLAALTNSVTESNNTRCFDAKNS